MNGHELLIREDSSELLVLLFAVGERQLKLDLLVRLGKVIGELSE